jgi:hypothetical protein
LLLPWPFLETFAWAWPAGADYLVLAGLTKKKKITATLDDVHRETLHRTIIRSLP